MRFATREKFSETRLQGRDKRRGVRLNSRVPVSVEWEETSGEARQASAHTRVVGPYGCLLVLPAEIAVERTVRLRNLATERSNEAMVVWCGQKQSDGWEMGIELIEPELDFWGLEL